MTSAGRGSPSSPQTRDRLERPGASQSCHPSCPPFPCLLPPASCHLPPTPPQSQTREGSCRPVPGVTWGPAPSRLFCDRLGILGGAFWEGPSPWGQARAASLAAREVSARSTEVQAAPGRGLGAAYEQSQVFVALALPPSGVPFKETVSAGGWQLRGLAVPHPASYRWSSTSGARLGDVLTSGRARRVASASPLSLWGSWETSHLVHKKASV